MSATWGAVARGWRVFAPAVVGGAAAQAALVVGDPKPLAGVGFALLVAASALVLAASVTVIAAGALSAVDRQRWRVPGTLVLWSVVMVVVAFAASLLASPLVLLAILLALLVLPAAADGRSNPFPAGFAVFRHGAARTIGALVVALLLLLLSWLVALLLGFFITGPIAAGLTWLWFGVVGVILSCWFTVRCRRAVS